MTNSNPIGIFDSGVGGLSVAHSIRKELPHENLLYVADLLHAPYGNKTKEYITQRSLGVTSFLLEKQAKAIVVACNTATVSSIQELRRVHTIPIIGIEPGVKPASFASNSGVVGVLATEQTIRSSSFQHLASRFSTDVTIAVQACPGLVEQIEKMNLDGTETKELIKRYVLPLLEKGADTLVLGCTHYAFLTPLIKKVAGTNVEVIDTNAAVAKEVVRRLHLETLESTSNASGWERFWTSGDPAEAVQKISRFWGRPVTVSQMP